MQKEIHVKHKRVELFFVGSLFEGAQNSLDDLATVFHTFLFEDLKCELKDTTLSINLCTDDKIVELNKEYRSKNKVTDVLSFPIQENLREELSDDFMPVMELGDIFICESVCREQANEFNLSFREEFIHLAVHGFLHLCGYDHEINDKEEKLMENLEEKLIKTISKRQ